MGSTDTKEFERSRGKRLWSQREVSELTIKKVTEFSDDKVQVCSFPKGKD